MERDKMSDFFSILLRILKNLTTPSQNGGEQFL